MLRSTSVPSLPLLAKWTGKEGHRSDPLAHDPPPIKGELQIPLQGNLRDSDFKGDILQMGLI
jgi:hypothetical protein